MIDKLFDPICIIGVNRVIHYYNLRTGKTYSNDLILNNLPCKLLIYGNCLKTEYDYDKKIIKITFYNINFNVNYNKKETSDYVIENICYIDNNYCLYDKDMKMVNWKDSLFLRMILNYEDLSLNKQILEDSEILKAVKDNFCPEEYYKDGKSIKINTSKELINFILLDCKRPNINKKYLDIVNNNVDFSLLLSDQVKTDEDNILIIDKINDKYFIGYFYILDGYIDCISMIIISKNKDIKYFEKNKYGDFCEINKIPSYMFDVKIVDLGFYNEILKNLKIDDIDLNIEGFVSFLYFLDREQFLKFCVEHKYFLVIKNFINYKNYINDKFDEWFFYKFGVKNYEELQAFFIAGVSVDIWDDYILYINKDIENYGAINFVKTAVKSNKINVLNNILFKDAYNIYINILKNAEFNKEKLDVEEIKKFAIRIRNMNIFNRIKFLRKNSKNIEIEKLFVAK